MRFSFFSQLLASTVLFSAALSPHADAQSACAAGDSCTVSASSATAAADSATDAAEQAKTKTGLPDAPSAQTGAVSGTVTDPDGDIIPGASVQLDGASRSDRQIKTANDSAFFEFTGLKPGITYHVTVTSPGFESWVSTNFSVNAGQFFDMTGIVLKLSGGSSSVTVYSSTEQIATQQVIVEEQQRVLGIIPNFYVVYDSKNAVPLTTKLKFKLALRVSVDPVSILGAAFLSAIDQAADTPDYQQGWKGYGQRFGANYADGITDIMFGGAILPSLLHQDPRYFYQGTGTVKSRMKHALSNPFICRGDNGKNQINYSSLGGDLISASISNAYYPTSNRGVDFVFTNFAISTAEREVSSLLQEFVIRKLTPSAKKQQN
ncbi:MAG: carboxypeptidase-like regulatory domain-containing protein [Terracidiphilus sp.]|nr:carboxypeptidase-like regulatory domain-containing protein [Terracidiphilus sp.]